MQLHELAEMVEAGQELPANASFSVASGDGSMPIVELSQADISVQNIPFWLHNLRFQAQHGYLSIESDDAAHHWRIADDADARRLALVLSNAKQHAASAWHQGPPVPPHDLDADFEHDAAIVRVSARADTSRAVWMGTAAWFVTAFLLVSAAFGSIYLDQVPRDLLFFLPLLALIVAGLLPLVLAAVIAVSGTSRQLTLEWTPDGIRANSHHFGFDQDLVVEGIGSTIRIADSARELRMTVDQPDHARWIRQRLLWDITAAVADSGATEQAAAALAPLRGQAHPTRSRS